jgi:uracil-DNA glycosylase
MKTLDRRLDAHRAELSACRRCALQGHVRPIVSQARSPRVMLVGQAPGKTEAEGGKPFAGRAGRTLFAWLQRAGIDEATARDRIYIAAVTRCFPGASASGRGDRVPSPAERASCASWLQREREIIRPKLIIPVGRLAIDAILGPRPLDAVIGREFLLDERTIVVPLPHPSGASSWIHMPGHAALLDEALRLLRRHWLQIERGARAA